MNQDKIILDLCGGTGSWAKPWKDAGYTVLTITLPDWSVTSVSFLEHTILFHSLKKTPPLTFYKKSVVGVLAAPPCTEFSRAKHFHGKGNYKNDFEKGLETVVACLNIIAQCNPQWYAIENPNGMLKRWMGVEQGRFEPWEYGDPYQKTTLLWGRFKMPPKTVSKKPAGIKKFSLLKSKEIAPEFYGKFDRTVRRSITPPAFAQAFYKANQ